MAEMTDSRTPEEYSDREFEQSKLQHDIEAVRFYGAAHPDEWTEVLFENEPTVRVVALFACSDPERHEMVLRELVLYPDQLDVREAEFSLSQLELMIAEAREIASSIGPGLFMSSSIGRGRINIQVAADQEKLAATLLARYGDAAVLHVGAFPYPNINDAGREERHGTIRPEAPLIAMENLDVTIVGDLTVISGRTARGSLRFHNRSSREVILRTNGGVTARVLEPSSGEVVGGYGGFQTMALIEFRAPPGRSVTVPLLVGTTSFKRELGYAVPSGEWMIDAVVDLGEQGRFRTPPFPIFIGARSD